ncbi:MAG: hypothetical protein WKG01_08640 [Kofleriaceae bacterium]
MSARAFENALRVKSERERLASLLPGGSPDRALSVTSAAVIEVRTAAIPCLHCRGDYRVEEHTRPRSNIRRIDVTCRQCSAPRTLWFRIVPDDNHIDIS